MQKREAEGHRIEGPQLDIPACPSAAWAFQRYRMLSTPSTVQTACQPSEVPVMREMPTTSDRRPMTNNQ